MDISAYRPNEADDVERLFTRTFSDSEGESEGAIVGGLAGELMRSTGESDLYGFAARENAELIGSILFSRMSFEREMNAFVLAPVATRTDHQRRGVGQKLITFGLNTLKEDGVELVVTYGERRTVTNQQEVRDLLLPDPSGFFELAEEYTSPEEKELLLFAGSIHAMAACSQNTEMSPRKPEFPSKLGWVQPPERVRGSIPRLATT